MGDFAAILVLLAGAGAATAMTPLFGRLLPHGSIIVPLAADLTAVALFYLRAHTWLCVAAIIAALVDAYYVVCMNRKAYLQGQVNREMAQHSYMHRRDKYVDYGEPADCPERESHREAERECGPVVPDHSGIPHRLAIGSIVTTFVGYALLLGAIFFT